MNPANSLRRVRAVYQEYPAQFWTLMGALFIDRLGGAVLFPFFTLYVTARYGVGMTEVGIIFGLFSISSVVGGVVGGALSDRIGRKSMLIAGLIISAASMLAMGLVNSIELFFGTALVVGLFASIGGPAQQAMVADLLPEEQRAQGFGILRVVINLAVTIGPAIGGLLAGRSFLFLFICDAVFSLITAVIVFFAMQETKPAAGPGAPQESVAQTFAGYGRVLRDVNYTLFIGASVLMTLVYMQMNTTLAVYLRDVHHTTEQGYGFIISLNAAMVVLFQFYITRRVAKYRPLTIMVAGSLLYAVGFGMYGVVSTSGLFMAAMVVITVGERR
ncbi:MAG: MDR family MFS transporter, partial [Anaerolineae bacterium]